MLVGQVVWGSLALVAAFFEADFVNLIAFPLAFVYFAIWGDNMWPTWASSIAPHIVFGLSFFGVIGALIGLWTNRTLRFSLRTLLIATTVVVVCLGLIK
jgi:hypothetical protein